MNHSVRTDLNHFVKHLLQALKPIAKAEGIDLTFSPSAQLQHVPVEALQGQKNAAADDLSKSFASLMLLYATGQEINMKETLKAFPMRLNSVSDYAKRVSMVSQPV